MFSESFEESSLRYKLPEWNVVKSLKIYLIPPSNDLMQKISNS